MHLIDEYDQLRLDPLHSWARLVRPGNDLPEISNAIERYVHMPWHLGRNSLQRSLSCAADMAAQYFDYGLLADQKKRKYNARYALMERSVEKQDGSLFFIRDKDDFYGYTRVMPVSNKQWEAYFEDQSITEAEFSACSKNLLRKGDACIYIQAIVFPEFEKTDKGNKRILQEAGFAGLVGQLLPNKLPAKGINIYFTAFHPYTESLANRLNIKKIGQNKMGKKIYGFTVSENQIDGSLGNAIAKRLQEGKKPFSRFGY